LRETLENFSLLEHSEMANCLLWCTVNRAVVIPREGIGDYDIMETER